MISAQIAADWYWAAWGWCLADIRRRRRVRLTVAFVHDGTTVCEYRGRARSSLWAAQVEGAEVEEVGLLGEADAGLGDEELAGTVKQGQGFFALPDFAEVFEIAAKLKIEQATAKLGPQRMAIGISKVEERLGIEQAVTAGPAPAEQCQIKAAAAQAGGERGQLDGFGFDLDPKRRQRLRDVCRQIEQLT